jgi:ribonuclease HII
MKYPNLSEEKKLWKRGFKRVACLDEAGIGPLAGPVAAAAVAIVDHKFKFFSAGLKDVNDSKKLSAKKREILYKLITGNKNIAWGIGTVDERAIDKVNIKNAAELAMRKALRGLERMQGKKADFLIFDGNIINSEKLKAIRHKLIVDADAKVFSCAAASILAKVTRDRLMMRCHKKYPKYRFDIHKGYPTRLHKKLLRKYGPCQIHRKSFGPVRYCINK